MALYRENGVEFVTLQEAERDPFYAADEKTEATTAPTSLEEAMKAKGLPVPPLALPFADLDKLCR